MPQIYGYIIVKVVCIYLTLPCEKTRRSLRIITFKETQISWLTYAITAVLSSIYSENRPSPFSIYAANKILMSNFEKRGFLKETINFSIFGSRFIKRFTP